MSLFWLISGLGGATISHISGSPSEVNQASQEI